MSHGLTTETGGALPGPPRAGSRPDGPRVRRPLAAALGLAAVLAGAAASGGPDTAASIREQGLAAVGERVAAEGRIKAYEDLADRIAKATQGAPKRNRPKVGVTGEVWEKISEALKDTPPDDRKPEANAKRMEAASEVEKKMGGRLKDAKKAWLAVAATSNLAEQEAKLKPAAGPGAGAAAGPAPAADFVTRWLPAFAAGAVALGLILLLWDERRAIRVRLRSRGSRALILALACLPAVAPGCTLASRGDAAAGDDDEEDGGAERPGAPEDAERRRLEKLKSWARKAENESAAARARAQELATTVKEQAKEAARLRLLGVLPRTDAPLGFDANQEPQGDAKEPFDRILAAEAEPQAKLIDALGAAGAAEELARHGLVLANDKDKSEADSAAWRGEFLTRGGRAALALGAVILAWIPLRISRRRRRRRLKEAAELCPRCQSRGTLIDIDRGDRDHQGRPILYKYCNTCMYEYPAMYARYESISFPTVGIPSSGKTLWMLSLYHKINTKDLPPGAKYRILPSGFNTIVDGLVDAMLIQRLPPSANRKDELTHPLVFYLQDRSRARGLGEVLINLFDFSGEMMFSAAYQDILRRRALQCGGFFVFLDPTNANYSAQINELRRFLGDLRTHRNTPFDKPLDIPVAVCVTKIDLLVTQNPMSEAARPWVADLRATSQAPISLRAIRWRSDHTARVIDQMFPGGNLGQILRDELGDRVMFFPLTPISIEDSQLGIATLAQRSLIPFGVLEPVYWLMHMNGYCVLQ